MGTFKIFSSSSFMIPSVSAIYLADLGEARGRQELYTRQSPQKLKALKEHALIESAVSSNRIEGVTIERSRERIPDLIRLAAWNFDFLCIHPFRDGNGRVSRLLLLLQLYHLGYEVGRYISLERIIEETKDRYYETLEISSDGWHKDKHDPWPYINYILYTIKTACNEFEARVSGISSPRGTKSIMVDDAIKSLTGEFSISEILDKCPGVSIDMVRKIFKEKQKTGELVCKGKGRDAKWYKNF